MGFISKKLLSKHRRRRSGKSRILPSAVTRLARAQLKEAKKGLATKLSKVTTAVDPNHKIYSLTQNMLSHFAEEISIRREFTEYCTIISKVEEEYMPSYPPMSPLTSTYFTYWAFCDLQFGKEKETIATIFYDIVKELNFDATILLALENLQESYMGLYQHLGFDGDFIRLKEISTNKEISCICPAGYQGKKNEIWFVRVVENLGKVHDYRITLTTPYVILNYGVKDWQQFIARQGIIGTPEAIEKQQASLFKYHPDFKYWHEYIMDGYVNFTSNNIFLTGMPDIKGSKPHELE